MTQTALITGIEGQDGHYLSRYLLELGINVHGIARYSSKPDLCSLDPNVTIHITDLTDSAGIASVIKKVKPSHIYNLAAMSHVGASFSAPLSTLDINGLGIVRILEAVRGTDIKVYQAGTSEMFGGSPPPQNEDTKFSPRSPYAVAKVCAHLMAANYREAYGIFVSNGILFNHESPLRGVNFVTRKITKGLARIKMGLQDHLELGNLDSKRDWGHAADYVRAMHMILEEPVPDDFVIATGVTKSVRQFATAAAEALDMDLEWEGLALEECAIDNKTGLCVISVNPDLFRPVDVEYLRGDASKAKRVLKWEPTITFDALVREMVIHDLKEATRGY